MIDLHSHVLPGIDDGADDFAEALAMLQVACDDGITAIAATPHQHPDGQYCNRNEKVTALVDELQAKAAAAGMGIKIFPAGEVLISPDVIDRVKAGVALPYVGGKYLLLEFPASEVPVYAREVVFNLLVAGITPVIAHPERNQGFANEPELLYEMVEAGALAQMTAGSVSRGAAPAIQELAALFLTHNLVHVIASDAHSPHRRPPVLERYARRIGEVLGEEFAHKLVHSTPAAILQGENVELAPPIAFTRQSKQQASRICRALADAGSRGHNHGGGGRNRWAAMLRLPWASGR